jgi:voltage-gated potassium channel
MTTKSLRRAVALQLDPELRGGSGLSPTNKALIVLIIISTVAAIIGTEPLISEGFDLQFRAFELGIGLVFLVEYFARLWVTPENPRYAGRSWPRLRFALSFSALIDLAAIIPIIAAFGGGGTVVLRFARVMRLVRLAKLGRMSRAWNDILTAIRLRREELLLTLGLALVLILVSSTLMYWTEGNVQPDKFGSIPRSFWWSVVTLTTVGYGDVYPITPLGKFCAALVAIAGIGLIAMPTGILAAAFSETVQRRKGDREKGSP